MKIRRLTTVCLATVLMGGMMWNAQAQDSFGSGANTFTIDFVEIGNPGNPDDTGTTGSYHTDTGGADPNRGGVASTFRMGTYEVSEDMINKANTLGGLGISKDIRGTNRPATSVSWNEAARFVNWLNTSSGHSAAYKFEFQPDDGDYLANASIQLWEVGDTGYDASNPYRNANAYYFLPSEDEWYKAAYHQNDGVTANYWDYATGSNTIPTAVASGTGAGTVVYDQTFATGPADVNLAGGLSPYGTMGQNGNVWEWNESAFDGVNNLTNEGRGVRGGFWGDSEGGLRSSIRGNFAPTYGDGGIGFRVASIPEPSSIVMLLLTFAASALLLRRRFSL